MKLSTTLILLVIATIWSAPASAQTSKISSVAIGTSSTAGGTANGVAIVTERIGTALNQPGSVGDTLAGIQYVPGQIPLDGSPASIAFFTLSGATIPGGAGNPATAFTSYGTLTSPTAVTTYIDVASKLTADSYSGLTFAEADLGHGSRDFYTIHHRPGTDYFAQIVPGIGTSTLIRDLKPMSWGGPTAGGPANVGTTGYFGLAWATGILSAGAPYIDQSIYYLRNDSGTPSHTQFGVMIPALTGASSDTIDLTTAVGSFGVGGYTTLAFSPAVIGNYGANQFYYLRQDNGTGGTGNTILGRLNPSLVAGVRTISDIANLGGVFTTLNFAADATGPAGAWGTNQFYITGALVSGAQSISFEAIPDHNVGDVFTITPTASSGLDIDVTVVSGPATIQTTGVSGATPLSLRVFTVTTTAPGIVTLQARQAGRSLPLPAYTANMLRQSFNVLGLPTVTSANSAPGTVGTAFTYNITATGSPTSYSASPLPAGLVLNATTGAITGTPSAVGSTVVTLSATNATGTSSTYALTITIAAAGTVPIVTSTNSAPATVGTAFTYNITATGSPTSYSASPLPAGLVVNTTTGAITGTPTTAATSVVTLTATNGTGTSSPSTVTITVAAAGTTPVITSATSAPATAGTGFTYNITATGSPTSYSASPLPAGLVLNAATGVITGTPTTAGSTVVTLSATNATGTSSSYMLTITVAAAGTVPIVTSTNSAPATVGTVFTYNITATGSPTSYSASPLPAGLVVSTATGAITGTPTTAGTTVVTLTATNGTGTSTPSTLTITTAAAGTTPVLTSATSAPATVGSAFTYSITATGTPTSYSATSLPAGLVLNPTSGVITGTPTTTGVSVATINAVNSSGTGTTMLTITVGGANVAPVITSPTSAPGTVGTPFTTYLIAATGLPTSYAATGLPPGLTLDPLTGAINGTPTTAGTYTVTLTATNSSGATTASLTITIAAVPVAPVITSPATAPGTAGTPFVTYLITASGLPTSYSATGLPAGLTLDPVTGAISGTPTTAGTSVVTLTATNATGSSTAVLTIVIAPPAAVASSRIMNFSARAISGPGSQTLIIGFIVSGDGKHLLIRGIGPTLGLYGVAAPLADPLLTLFGADNLPAVSNDDWQTPIGGQSSGTLIASTAAQVGAFALPNGSKDSALLATINNGAHTTGLVRPNSTTGVALTEIYDTDTTSSSRLINVSARMNVTSGEGTLIAGFIVQGNAPKTLLIRGVGPTLAAFGVAGVLANPKITVFASNTVIATNDDWETGGSTVAQVISTSLQVGAFALPTGSKDAVLLMTVQPGLYTVQVTGVGNTSGVALVEVYDTE